MPRTSRFLLENVCYHIITRGNQRQHIFLDESDYFKLLQLIERYKVRYRFRLYAYCLMNNHIHFLIEIRHKDNLAKIMQGLCQAYTIWFNRKYHKVGHLWQGRYKSILIVKDEYFIECINYIELNPVRAKIVDMPTEYPWSSYRDRICGLDNKLVDEPHNLNGDTAYMGTPFQ